MSEENVEIVRAGIEAWNAGDMDAVREVYDPDVIVRPPRDWPEAGPFIGRDAVMRQNVQLREAFDTDVIEPVSFIDAADRVAIRHIWRGAGHGPDASLEITAVYTVREGRIFYVEYFWDHTKALATMGLEEQAVSQQNVEIVQAHFAARNRRDLMTLLALWRSDGEIDWSRSGGPLRGVYRGRREQETFWNEFWSTFADVQLETHGFTEMGSEVVVPNTAHMKGREGIEVDARSTLVFTVENAQITRLRLFQEQAEALKAVGLI